MIKVKVDVRFTFILILEVLGSIDFVKREIKIKKQIKKQK